MKSELRGEHREKSENTDRRAALSDFYERFTLAQLEVEEWLFQQQIADSHWDNEILLSIVILLALWELWKHL